MQPIEEIEALIRELDARESNEIDEAASAFETLKSHPKVYDVQIETSPVRLVVTTMPVQLKNPSGSDSLDLGRLQVFVNSDGSYGVTRDSTSPRDSHLTSGNVHPHVSNGSICQGNATDMTKLAHEKRLTMLVTFIIEFLEFYNPSSPYWHAFFKHPCEECGEERGGSACKFCKCYVCSDWHSNDSCPGCEYWKQPSASAARSWVVRFLDTQTRDIDEDAFIKCVADIETIVNTARKE